MLFLKKKFFLVLEASKLYDILSKNFPYRGTCRRCDSYTFQTHEPRILESDRARDVILFVSNIESLSIEQEIAMIITIVYKT
jgi:hypothetical protein